MVNWDPYILRCRIAYYWVWNNPVPSSISSISEKDDRFALSQSPRAFLRFIATFDWSTTAAATTDTAGIACLHTALNTEMSEPAASS